MCLGQCLGLLRLLRLERKRDRFEFAILPSKNRVTLTDSVGPEMSRLRANPVSIMVPLDALYSNPYVVADLLALDVTFTGTTCRETGFFCMFVDSVSTSVDNWVCACMTRGSSICSGVRSCSVRQEWTSWYDGGGGGGGVMLWLFHVDFRELMTISVLYRKS